MLKFQSILKWIQIKSLHSTILNQAVSEVRWVLITLTSHTHSESWQLTDRITHPCVKLVPVETLVDGSTAGPHIVTQSLPVVSTRQEQLAVFVVVVSL